MSGTWITERLVSHCLKALANGLDELCFDVAIGGPYRIYLNDIGSANRIAGREPLIYEAMSKIINYYSLPWQLPKKHRIVVTHKSYSQWARNPEGRHRAIANHVEVAGWLREAYPEVDVDIIEWQKLGVKGNLEELGKTTILLTPCGGVSMMLPFLPPGSHAIVMGESGWPSQSRGIADGYRLYENGR